MLRIFFLICFKFKVSKDAGILKSPFLFSFSSSHTLTNKHSRTNISFIIYILFYSSILLSFWISERQSVLCCLSFFSSLGWELYRERPSSQFFGKCNIIKFIVNLVVWHWFTTLFAFTVAFQMTPIFTLYFSKWRTYHDGTSITTVITLVKKSLIHSFFKDIFKIIFLYIYYIFVQIFKSRSFPGHVTFSYTFIFINTC